MNTDHDTIVAPATAAGGAIAVIRISGGEAFAVCDRIFRGRRPLAEADGYTVHYGTIAEGDRVIDDVLAAVSAPRTPTRAKTRSKSRATAPPTSSRKSSGC